MYSLVTRLVPSWARPRGDEPLEARVEAVLKTPGYESGHWGLLVVDAKTGKTVYERNADELFCPASVTKIFSTAAALTDLGADYRFQTPVVRRGNVDEDGTLHGDLILVAKGDLCLGGRTGPDGSLLFVDDDHTYAGANPRTKVVDCDPLAGLDHLAREVVASGIKAVSGEVIVDDRLFDAAESTGSGPSRVSPVVVNDNVVDVIVTPAEQAGEPADVRLVPPSAFVSADVEVETTAKGGPATLEVRSVGPRRFTVRGKVPAGHAPLVRIYEVDDPASFARALFIETLRKRGVRVEAASVADNPPHARLPTRATVAGLPKVAEYTSPPFREYLRVILKVSHNLHASTLPMLLAAHHGETTLGQGLTREGALLKGLGVAPGSVSFGGGAGGSRSDLVSPRATVGLLRSLAVRPDFPAFEAALPVLGRDGTLARSVPHDSPARGHARAKTGTFWVENALDGKAVLTSKALAGYMETASGQPLVFAVFVNNVPLDAAGPKVSDATAAAGRLLGKLCEAFYALDGAGGQTARESAAAAPRCRSEASTPRPTRPRPGGRPRPARGPAGAARSRGREGLGKRYRTAVVNGPERERVGLDGLERLDEQLLDRQRDLEVRVLEPLLDLAEEPVLDPAGEARLGHVRMKDEDERRVADLLHQGRGDRVAEHVGVVAGDRQEQVGDAVGVGAVGHFDADRGADHLVFEGPVDQVARDEGAVGDDHALVVAVGDRRGADVDPVDLAGHPADGDDVADPDRPLQQQDDPADEVRDDLLEPEAEPDAERREHHADLLQTQVDRRQRGEQAGAQHGVPAEGHDREPDARVVGHPREDDHGEERAHVTPGRPAEGDDQQRPRQLTHGHEDDLARRPSRPARPAARLMNRKRARSTSQTQASNSRPNPDARKALRCRSRAARSSGIAASSRSPRFDNALPTLIQCQAWSSMNRSKTR